MTQLLEFALTVKPLKVFVNVNRLGGGSIYRIQQAIPDIARFEIHSQVTPIDLVQVFKANEGKPILIDATAGGALSPEIVHIIKAAVDGEVYINSALSGEITAKVSGIVVALHNQDTRIFGRTVDHVMTVTV